MRFIYTRTFTIAFSIFVGIALIIILDAKGYLGLARDGFTRVYGYSSGAVATGVSGSKEFFKTFFTIRKLVSENAALQQKINELSFEDARLQTSREENIALRKSLNFKQSSPLNLVPVEVIGSDPTGFSQTIIIDKGSEEGIAQNSAVVVSPGLLVGKVTSLSPHSAQVTLITDPSVVVSAIVSDSGAQGLISGEHGLGLSFNLVSQNEVIKTTDNVVTSGLSGDFPPGLLIGQIDSIKSAGSDLFQKAFVAPAADLRNLKFVFVVQT
jgi:rod shape-determining protein MreC